MPAYSTYSRLFTAIGLSLLFLVPYLGRTLHRYHAEDHVRIHHCDDQQQEQQHLHDPDALDWHHCSLCTVPAPVREGTIAVAATATPVATRQVPVTFAVQPPFIWPRNQLTVRGPPAIS